MFKMILTGMRRRIKEISYVTIVTFVASLFLMSITVFQELMNSNMFYTNQQNYGKWLVSSAGERLNHAYLENEILLKVGNSIVDEDGYINLIYPGYCEDDFLDIAGDFFYEGRLPQKEGEIVVDAVSLALLGYSLELEQEIELCHLDANGVLYTKQYTLVGITKCIASTWQKNNTVYLPNILLSESDFYAICQKVSNVFFYTLKEEYKDIDTLEFYSESFEEYSDVAYNYYVYGSTLWSSAEMYRNVNYVITGVATLAISYLLISYIGKRREVFYRYRAVGASKWKVRWIATVECLLSSAPAAALGMVVPFGVTMLAAMVLKIPFDVSAKLVWSKVMAIGIVIAIGTMLALIAVRDKKIAQNVNTVKPRYYKVLRLISKISRDPSKSFTKRWDVVRPFGKLVSILFSIVTVACLILCIDQMVYESRSIQWALSMQDDMVVWKSLRYEQSVETGQGDGVTTYGYDLRDMTQGINPATLEQFANVFGTKKIEKQTLDQWHIFEWQGMEESERLKERKSQIEHPDLLHDLDMTISGYDNIDAVKAESENLGIVDSIDWETFEKGEGIIMVVREPDDTIQVGDTIWAKHIKEGTKTSFKVLAVIESIHSDTFWANTYKMVCSTNGIQRIAEGDGVEWAFNNIVVEYDNNASYQSTDKQFAYIAKRNELKYVSSAESIRVLKQEYIKSMSAYLAIFLIVLVVYIVLQRSFLISRTRYLKESFVLMKRVGMNNIQYLTMMLWSEIKTHMWIVGGFAAGLGLVYLYWIKYYEESIRTSGGQVYHEVLNTFVSEASILAKFYFSTETWDGYNWLFAILFIVILFIILILSSAQVIVKSTKEEV